MGESIILESIIVGLFCHLVGLFCHLVGLSYAHKKTSLRLQAAKAFSNPVYD
jgi:hypothetical protein